ncbi:MAG: NUDIX domain-containing protein [Treponemataceae bacterium]
MFEHGKRWRCASCDFQYFHNVATAAGAVIESDGKVVFIVRAVDPAAGLLALPGGFVDPGERAEDAVTRECREEIGWVPDAIEFLASFPNRYEYRNVIYNTCDFFFLARTNGLGEKDFTLDPVETSGVRFIKPEDINPNELAFDSTRRAIEVYLAMRGLQ